MMDPTRRLTASVRSRPAIAGPATRSWPRAAELSSNNSRPMARNSNTPEMKSMEPAMIAIPEDYNSEGTGDMNQKWTSRPGRLPVPWNKSPKPGTSRLSLKGADNTARGNAPGIGAYIGSSPEVGEISDRQQMKVCDPPSGLHVLSW